MHFLLPVRTSRLWEKKFWRPPCPLKLPAVDLVENDHVKCPGGQGLCLRVITVASFYSAFTPCQTLLSEHPVLQVARPPREEGAFCRRPRCTREEAEASAWAAVVQLPGDSCLALEVAVPPGAVCGARSTSVMRAQSLPPAGLLGWLGGRNEWGVALLKRGAAGSRCESGLRFLLPVPRLLAERPFPCL